MYDYEASKKYVKVVSVVPKKCWNNAFKLFKKKPAEFKYYVEGWVIPGDFDDLIAIEHGWLEDLDDKTIDITLAARGMKQGTYFAGVRYTYDQIKQIKEKDLPYVYVHGGFGGFKNPGYLKAYKAAMKFCGFEM
jgi:hypothetical protein